MEGMIWADWFGPGECAPSMRPLEPAPDPEPEGDGPSTSAPPQQGENSGER